MKIEIRKSFTKDADKLPAPFQRHLAGIIDAIEKASQPAQLSDCKSLPDIKRLTAFGWVITGLVFIMKTKQLSLCGYFTEKKFIATSHNTSLTYLTTLPVQQ